MNSYRCDYVGTSGDNEVPCRRESEFYVQRIGERRPAEYHETCSPHLLEFIEDAGVEVYPCVER